ncbi:MULTISPECIES: STAS domain-containing protein [Streptomyces]|uniref:STAS domain-containing protein n=1 Tax=Streptomyces TaxID=1883 RepID=UPI002277267C|nr:MULTISPECIES: anti-sigma factor antagonist [Streptomyces]
MVVELLGDIDISTAPEVCLHLAAVTSRQAPDLLLDLRPVTFFDCQGVRLLMFAQQRMWEQRGQFYLVCDSPQILRILSIIGLFVLFHPSPTIDRALADIEGPRPPCRLSWES